MFKLPFLLISVLALHVSGQEFCDKYFFSYPLMATWSGAVQACREIGQYWDVVSIQNVLKSNELDTFLRLNKANNLTNIHIWTSGHRRAYQLSEEFTWTDHLETISFQRWGLGEPQTTVTDANIAMTSTDNVQWEWVALRQGQAHAYYICERKWCFS